MGKGLEQMFMQKQTLKNDTETLTVSQWDVNQNHN